MGAIELFMSDGARGCQAVILDIDAEHDTGGVNEKGGLKSITFLTLWTALIDLTIQIMQTSLLYPAALTLSRNLVKLTIFDGLQASDRLDPLIGVDATRQFLHPLVH